jgi:hypothetical protein
MRKFLYEIAGRALQRSMHRAPAPFDFCALFIQHLHAEAIVPARAIFASYVPLVAGPVIAVPFARAVIRPSRRPARVPGQCLRHAFRRMNRTNRQHRQVKYGPP